MHQRSHPRPIALVGFTTDYPLPRAASLLRCPLRRPLAFRTRFLIPHSQPSSSATCSELPDRPSFPSGSTSWLNLLLARSLYPVCLHRCRRRLVPRQTGPPSGLSESRSRSSSSLLVVPAHVVSIHSLITVFRCELRCQRTRSSSSPPNPSPTHHPLPSLSSLFLSSSSARHLVSLCRLPRAFTALFCVDLHIPTIRRALIRQHRHPTDRRASASAFWVVELVQIRRLARTDWDSQHMLDRD